MCLISIALVVDQTSSVHNITSLAIFPGFDKLIFHQKTQSQIPPHLQSLKKVETLDAKFEKIRNFAQPKLSRCLDSPSCGQNSSLVPKRLIDVAVLSNNIVRLIELIDQFSTDHYLALSYCWGEFPTFVTTVENLSQRVQSFPMTDVPRTLQDAVRLTRILNIRFLWTDALCILQGSDATALEDWAEQSALMADIYGNALLMLQAASA